MSIEPQLSYATPAAADTLSRRKEFWLWLLATLGVIDVIGRVLTFVAYPIIAIIGYGFYFDAALQLAMLIFGVGVAVVFAVLMKPTTSGYRGLIWGCVAAVVFPILASGFRFVIHMVGL